jgi:hypothetical protein
MRTRTSGERRTAGASCLLCADAAGLGRGDAGCLSKRLVVGKSAIYVWTIPIARK